MRRVVVAVALSLIAVSAAAQSSDMFIFKSAPGTATVGSNITFTVTVGNGGPDDAPFANFDDVLPADVTFVSINQTTGPTFTCNTPQIGTTGTITCSINPLAAGAVAQFDIVVLVSPTAAGTTLINTATTSSENPDDTNENNTSITGTTVPGGNLADVRILKTGPASAPPNTDVAYTITLTNDGPGGATNVSWTDTLPNSAPPGLPMTFVSLTQNSGLPFTCSPGATTTCGIALFPSGSSATFTLVGHVPSGSTGRTYSNVASVTSDNDPNSENDSSGTGLIVSSADVGIIKSAPATAIAGGPTFDYVITLSNSGPDAASDVSFSDTLPAGITFVSLTQDTGPAATCNGGPIVACTIPLLGNNQTAQFTITVQAASTIPNGTVVNNTANATSSSADSNSNNNSSTAGTTINAQADVAVAKNGPATAINGTDVTYTVTVTNNGPSTAANVVMTEGNPPNTTFVSATQNSGPTFTCNTNGTTGITTCSIASLAVSATATFTFVIHLPSGGGTTFMANTANVSTTTADPNSNNNQSTVSTTVSSQADVSVAKSAPGAATAGSNVTYTITVANAGPSDAANVTMSDTLPAGTTFVSESQTTGPTFTCTTGATVSCSIASLVAGASATFSITVTIAPATPSGTVITNMATVASSTTDPAPNNNSSSASTTVGANADVSVAKSAPAAGTAGTNITYTITVANAGPSNAANVTMSDTLPAGTTFVSESQTTGPTFTCTTGAAVSCSIASLVAGASATFSITVTIAPATPNGTVITNSATVSSSTPDPSANNNTSSASTTVATNADLGVTKNGPTFTPSNTNVIYNVTATNAGPSDAASVTLTETVPAGMTFVSVNQTTGPTFNCTGTGPVVCTIATFAAGATASTPAGTQTSNAVTISSTTLDPNPNNNTASVSTTIGQSIPALSPLAMALLAMMLAAAGWMALRR
jgi:uncharacterized repeat protein (TIGR01451 family)